MRVAFLVLALLAAQPAASAQPAADRALGAWSAEEDYFRATLLIERDADGALVAFFAGPDLSRGARLSSAAVRGDSLFLQADAVGAAFRGAVSRSDRQITGVWTQQGMTVALTLVPAASRPDAQAPPPAPYASHDVVLEGAGVRLAGTLTVPDGPGPHPAAVLVPGTGTNDWDYETDGRRPFLALADHLTRRGIAVLRYDERGAGVSGGDPFTAGFEGQAQDLAAVVRTLKGRPEIDAKRVGVVGHSVGGVLAPHVHGRLERAAFLVLLMAPSTPLGDLLRGQSPRMAAASGAPDLEVERQRTLSDAVIGAAAADTDSLTAAAAMAAAFGAAGWTADAREAGVRANTSPFWRDLVRHDPGPALEALDVPVLAVYGRADLAVTARENAAPMTAALEAGSGDATVVILGDLDHSFSEAELDAVSPRLLDLVAHWIVARTDDPPSRP